MKTLTVSAALVLLTACSFLKANEATLTADGETLAACVIAEAVGGDTSAATIAVKCGVPAAGDVMGLIGKLLADIDSLPSDAGLSARSSVPSKDAFVTALRAVK